MADAEQATTDTTAVETEDAKTTEPSITDLMGMIGELKKSQSGSDKKVLELSSALTQAEKEKEELQKQSMNDKQRAEFELEQQRKKNESTAVELAQRELALERANIITELSIPKDLALFVQGKDRNDILSNAKNLMQSYNDAMLKEVNRKLATDGGPEPQTGDGGKPNANVDWPKIWAMPPGPEKDAAIDEAFKKGGGGLQM